MPLSSPSMAVVALATALLLKPVAAQAVDYEPVKLAWMILYADAIALVERMDPRAASYRVTSVLQLKGEVLPDKLLITEPSRWQDKPYKNYTQRVLVFLQHRSNDKQWQLLGAGGEGYAPVDDGFVYLQGVAPGNEKPAAHRVAGESLFGIRLPLDSLMEVIRDVRNCYPSSHRQQGKRESLCSARELETLAASSELHAAVFNDVIRIAGTVK